MESTECIYGMLKRRFPIIKGMRTHLDHSMAISLAVCILHNIATLWNMPARPSTWWSWRGPGRRSHSSGRRRGKGRSSCQSKCSQRQAQEQHASSNTIRKGQDEKPTVKHLFFQNTNKFHSSLVSDELSMFILFLWFGFPFLSNFFILSLYLIFDFKFFSFKRISLKIWYFKGTLDTNC